MPLGTWVLVGAGAVIALCLLVVAIACLVRRCRCRQIEIRMQPTATEHVDHGKGDWYVRVKAEFHNCAGRDLEIRQVIFTIQRNNGKELTPRETCGDLLRHARKLRHPPDLTLKMPILLSPDTKAEYLFDVFFDGAIPEIAHDGTVKLHVETDDGVKADAQSPLPKPRRKRRAPTV